MQPGELRNRIEIQRLTKTQGIYGDTKISFLPLKKSVGEGKRSAWKGILGSKGIRRGKDC